MNVKLITLVAVVMLSLIAAVSQVKALEYEDKPDIAAYVVGSNHLDRGEQKTIYITIYNPAERKRVSYSDKREATFFVGREDMFFTAYNVEVKLEGNEYFEVKTPKQKIPALPPLKPINLAFIVKVSDKAKTGKYNLNLSVKFDRIYELSYLDVYSPQLLPIQKTVQGKNETISYKYEVLTKGYEIKYEDESKNITIPMYVKERDVKLEVVKVTTENMVGKSKGKLVVEVKNVGEKVAKNAYIVLETPSEFKLSKPSTLSLSQSMPAQMPMQMPMQSQMQMPMQMPMQTMSQMPTSQAPAYYVGEIKPNDIVKATFYVKIDTKDDGNYTFEVKAIYLDEYGKVKESDPVPFGVYVSKAPDFEVKSVESKVFVNAKGDVIVKLIPTTDLKDVSVYITANPPLSVLSNEYYLGDVKTGREYTAIFKVKASDEARPVIYPAEISLKYRSMDEYFKTDSKSIGVKVNPKMKFEVYGIPKIAAGSTDVVAFKLKNVGDFTIKEATARLTITDPFSSDDDTAYIGNLKPNETAEIKFKLSVDSDATPKKYGLNLEVKYKDLEGEWAISEPTKAIIEVTPMKPPYGMIAVILVIAMVAIIYYLRRSKK